MARRIKLPKLRSMNGARLGWLSVLFSLGGLMACQLSGCLNQPPRFGLSPDKELDALVTAVLLRDPSLVQQALQQNADVNAYDVNGQTPLGHDALYRNPNSAKIARLLIEHGADVNRPDGMGVTPLARAATCGNDPVVQVLLSAGADPNRPSVGAPCLHAAALRVGSEQTVRLLLEYGADPNAMHQGWTALDSARLMQNDEVIRMLEHSASVCMRNSSSRISH